MNVERKAMAQRERRQVRRAPTKHQAPAEVQAELIAAAVAKRRRKAEKRERDAGRR